MSRRKIIPYNPKLKPLAKQLRHNMTLAEVLLWNRLKGKQMRGYDFDRQRPIDEYIVDFYCKELMLAIEVDGGSHDHASSYTHDTTRQQRLEQLGVHVLRFRDEEVKQDIENVLWGIEGWIIEHGRTHPYPSQEGNRSPSAT
jgi:very-short-patch-repair endonuclease